MLTNIERKEFKDVAINFLDAFTNVKVKRLSSFGNNGVLVWNSDRLNDNTNLVILRNRGYMHLISGFNIVNTIKIKNDE